MVRHAHALDLMAAKARGVLDLNVWPLEPELPPALRQAREEHVVLQNHGVTVQVNKNINLVSGINAFKLSKCSYNIFWNLHNSFSNNKTLFDHLENFPFP